MMFFPHLQSHSVYWLTLKKQQPLMFSPTPLHMAASGHSVQNACHMYSPWPDIGGQLKQLFSLKQSSHFAPTPSLDTRSASRTSSHYKTNAATCKGMPPSVINQVEVLSSAHWAVIESFWVQCGTHASRTDTSEQDKEHSAGGFTHPAAHVQPHPLVICANLKAL